MRVSKLTGDHGRNKAQEWSKCVEYYRYSRAGRKQQDGFVKGFH